MKFSSFIDFLRDNHCIQIEFGKHDFVNVKFDANDRALIDECNKSELVHDKLLMLEMMFRRKYEQEALRKLANSKLMEFVR